MGELLVAEEISKVVGWLKKETIVNRVSINLNAGEIMGFIGPNGAGKTTTMKMLLGLTSITSGSARIFGAPVPTPASRMGVGFLPEAIQHPSHLSVGEYVRFHARLSGLLNYDSGVEEQLRNVEMWVHRDRLLKECSKGMRQRADIARLLLCRARLIFLDEPFSGLDPCGQVMLKTLLISLKEQNIGVMVNSHAAGILADVCDRVCMMNHGKIIVSGTLEKLLATSKTRVVAQFSNSTSASDFSAAQSDVPHLIQEPNGIEFLLDSSNRQDELIKAIIAAGGKLTTIAPVNLTLDQFFVKALAGQTGGNA